MTKHFTPPNRTPAVIETSVLELIRAYPDYGPRAIKYLLEEIGHPISESAVFNIMKRHHLTCRKERHAFARRRPAKPSAPSLDFDSVTSGECWLFWMTDLGRFDTTGPLYLYTFMDWKSQIACTRLYSEAHYKHFEDLMNAVALPVARTLNFDVRYLCLVEDTKLAHGHMTDFADQLKATILDNGLELSLKWLTGHNNKRQALQNSYTQSCLAFLMPFIHQGLDFQSLKIRLQHFVRTYNIHTPLMYEAAQMSPIDYHKQTTSNPLILPLWAYIDRQY